MSYGLRPRHRLHAVFCAVGEGRTNGPPGAPGLVGRPETCLSSSDLGQHVASDIVRGANNVCGCGISRDS